MAVGRAMTNSPRFQQIFIAAMARVADEYEFGRGRVVERTAPGDGGEIVAAILAVGTDEDEPPSILEFIRLSRLDFLVFHENLLQVDILNILVPATGGDNGSRSL